MTDQAQKFDVLLRRDHLTETRTPFPESPELTLPVTDSVIVRVSAPFDALVADNDDKLLALACEQQPPAPRWGSWTLRAVRDAYDFPAPPALAFPAESPAGLSLALSLARYPSLYGSDAFAAYKVFEHWFCTVGNGFDWSEAGWLRAWDTPDVTPELVTEAQRLATLPDAQEKLARYQRSQADAFAQAAHTGVPVGLYPISDAHSAICTLPDNVEDSFLVAAFQLAQYLLSRPIWENCSYSPGDLTGLGQEVYQSEAWRHVTLAEGMRQRAAVDTAYSRMVLHPVLGPRLQALRCEDKGFGPLNYSLPPRFRIISPYGKAAPVSIPAQAVPVAQIDQVIAGLQILRKHDGVVYCEHDVLYAGGGDATVVSPEDTQLLDSLGWYAGDHGWQRSV